MDGRVRLTPRLKLMVGTFVNSGLVVETGALEGLGSTPYRCTEISCGLGFFEVGCDMWSRGVLFGDSSLSVPIKKPWNGAPRMWIQAYDGT